MWSQYELSGMRNSNLTHLIDWTAQQKNAKSQTKTVNHRSVQFTQNLSKQTKTYINQALN
jgi:hypothetical protein